MSEASSQLRQWVEAQWPQLKLNDFALRADFDERGDRAPNWQALHGDAGFRRYFRLASEPPLLAVYAPPESENSQKFIEIARHLRHHGVLSPAIAAADSEQGFLLIEDLGPTLLLNELTSQTVGRLYTDALSSLLLLQQTPAAPLDLPLYSKDLLIAEMQLFNEWFVEQLLGYRITVADHHMLNHWFELLSHSALAQPQVLVHRDFHSRNLIFRESEAPGVIDFQDAVVGPFTYDLVSLLRDCYIAWPDQDVTRWALSYLAIARATDIVPEVATSQFLKWFDWMGIQRHVKVLGVFSRLSLRDGKHGYLNDLPLVMHYTRSIAERYPEGREFTAWFDVQIMPLARQQPWFNPSVIA